MSKRQWLGLAIALAGLIAVVFLGVKDAGLWTILAIADAVCLCAVGFLSLNSITRSLAKGPLEARAAIRAPLILMLIKMPVMAVLVYLLFKLPSPTYPYFLAALGLVYFAYIWIIATA